LCKENVNFLFATVPYFLQLAVTHPVFTVPTNSPEDEDNGILKMPIFNPYKLNPAHSLIDKQISQLEEP
jgi:hypothetical protein